MNRHTSLGILVAVGLLSGALGFWTRIHSQRAVARLNPASVDATRIKDSRARSNKSAQAVVSGSPRMVQFKKDLAKSTGVTRWLHWMEAIENADAADFAELSRLADGDPQLFQLVVARWSERYPKQMFETLAARVRAGGNNQWEALNTLFGNWAKMNAAEMMENLDSIADFGARSGWRMQAVNYAMQSDVELGPRYIARWNIENYSPNMTPVSKWAAANPGKAAQFVLDNPAGAATESAIKAVAREWARQDPVAALAFAKQNAGSLSSTMARATMAQWAEENIDGASAWLAKSPPAARSELSDTLIEKWANRDLNGAMEWAQNNLTGGDLSRAVASVIRGAADVNVSNAASLVENMPASVARSEAAAAVAKRWFPASFQNDAPPADAIQWLSNLDNESVRRALTEVSWQWQETDSSGMAAFLENKNVQGPAGIHLLESRADPDAARSRRRA